MVDIVAGKLHTKFGIMTLFKPERALCSAPLHVQECTDTDSAIKHNRPVVEELLEHSCSGLPSEQQSALRVLVGKFTDIFAGEAPHCTHTNLVQHEIDTGSVQPIRMWLPQLPFTKRAATEKKLWGMHTMGVIEPSGRPWSFPVVLVHKKDELWQFCLD